MITAPASDMSAATAISPPNSAVMTAVPSRPARPALTTDDQGQHGHRGEHETDDGEPGRHERHLELVAHEHGIGKEAEAPEQRDQQHHAHRREPDRADVGTPPATGRRCLGAP